MALAQAVPAATATSTTGPGGAAPQAGTPEITVVGFGVANLPTSTTQTAAGYQLDWNLATHGLTAGGALQRLETDVAAAENKLRGMGIPPAEISEQGPPFLNASAPIAAKCAQAQKVNPHFQCPSLSGGYQASVGIVVSSSSLAQTVRFLDRLGTNQLPGQQNFFLNGQSGGQAATPTPEDVATAYGQALAQAKATAQMIAVADGLTLGPQVTLTEGAPTEAQCGQMGGCNTGVAPGIVQPTVGAGQMLVALTVTYATLGDTTSPATTTLS